MQQKIKTKSYNVCIYFFILCYSDLQLKPYRTEEFVHKLYYETARFSAFNFQWVVKTRINNMQRDPALSVDRHMSYQVISCTKCLRQSEKTY